MGISEGEKVVVIGSGANGISIAACAAIKGGIVTIVGNESRREQSMKTGIAANDYGWWYIRNGALDLTYNGPADNQYGTWNVVNGHVEV